METKRQGDRILEGSSGRQAGLFGADAELDEKNMSQCDGAIDAVDAMDGYW